MAANTSPLTDATFDEEIKSSQVPVLVDFWAEWCGPCRTVGPILDEIAAEKTGAVRVLKLNVDENPEVTRRFAVQSIPTMILFNKGEATDVRIIGARSKQQLLDAISPHLQS